MAEAFEARTSLVRNVPTVGWEGLRSSVDGKNREETTLDRFQSSYYQSSVDYQPHIPLSGHDGLELWFSEALYRFHQAYNNAAAESLGVIADRISPGTADTKFYPDWQWKANSNLASFRVHGAGDRPGFPDIDIESQPPSYSTSKQIFVGAGIALVACALVGWLMHAVTRKLFVSPAERPTASTRDQLVEAIDASDQLLILIPSWDVWQSLGKDRSIDIRSIAQEPDWGTKYTGTD